MDSNKPIADDAPTAADPAVAQPWVAPAIIRLATSAAEAATGSRFDAAEQMS